MSDRDDDRRRYSRSPDYRMRDRDRGDRYGRGDRGDRYGRGDRHGRGDRYRGDRFGSMRGAAAAEEDEEFTQLYVNGLPRNIRFEEVK